MAWESLGFRQDDDVRSFLLVKSRVVVITEGSSRRLLGEHPIDDFFLRAGKEITDVCC